MRKIPNFTLLRAFEAAARLESFTLAGKELHLTQSAISHQIRDLEDHFGKA
ncbi:MAG: LysR family transcriptional regulator, partial [Polynucleobacter sp.]